MTALEHQVLDGELVTVADRLERCESVIRQSYIDRGLALKLIRDERLYRESYPTFEAYCADRWDMTRNYADKSIAAAELALGMSTNGTQPPSSERQARELGGLEPEQAAEVMDEARERTNGKPTAGAIRDARADLIGDRGRKPESVQDADTESQPRPSPTGSDTARQEEAQPDTALTPWSNNDDVERQRDRGRRDTCTRIAECVRYLDGGKNYAEVFLSDSYPHEHRFLAEPMWLTRDRIDSAIQFLTTIRKEIKR